MFSLSFLFDGPVTISGAQVFSPFEHLNLFVWYIYRCGADWYEVIPSLVHPKHQKSSKSPLAAKRKAINGLEAAVGIMGLGLALQRTFSGDKSESSPCTVP